MRRLALALALLGCPAGAQTDADPDAIACHAFTPDAEYVETTVIRQLEGGEVTLRVPAQYFEDYWDQRGGSRDTAQLFRVEMGSWKPVTREETGTRNTAGVWNWMTFTLGDVVALERVATIGADLFAAQEVPLAAYPPRSSPEGLAWLDSPYASDKKWPKWDVFVDPVPPAPLTTVIQCSSPLDPVSRSPTCTQIFRASGLDAQLLYGRTELPRWREFQAEVMAFAACARSDPA